MVRDHRLLRQGNPLDGEVRRYDGVERNVTRDIIMWQMRKKQVAWRKKILRDNQRKAAKSPFVVDLVAETERIDEEVQVRLQFESQMGTAEAKRKV